MELLTDLLQTFSPLAHVLYEGDSVKLQSLSRVIPFDIPLRVHDTDVWRGLLSAGALLIVDSTSSSILSLFSRRMLPSFRRISRRTSMPAPVVGASPLVIFTVAFWAHLFKLSVSIDFFWLRGGTISHPHLQTISGQSVRTLGGLITYCMYEAVK